MLSPKIKQQNQTWQFLPESKLLKRRISSLKLKTMENWFSPLIAQISRELMETGLNLKPLFYLSDEWFSPEGLVAVAIPFYLAHPRLIQLEGKLMHDKAEGATPGEFLKLLRHEVGHCFDHAHRVSRRSEWRRLFGHQENYIPSCYLPKPFSRRYVRHLSGFYAQAHPDEDFAETFATVITPNSNWEKRYENWPTALAKCRYVNGLIKQLGTKRCRTIQRPLLAPTTHLHETLAAYYKRRQREAANGFPGIYDASLKKIFLTRKSNTSASAAFYLQAYQDKIVADACANKGLAKHQTMMAYRYLVKRSDQMGLQIDKHNPRLQRQLADLLATSLQTQNYS